MRKPRENLSKGHEKEGKSLNWGNFRIDSTKGLIGTWRAKRSGMRREK